MPWRSRGGRTVGIALEVLEDRALNVLEDEVQLGFAAEDFDQVDDVVVLELLPHECEHAGRTPRARADTKVDM